MTYSLVDLIVKPSICLTYLGLFRKKLELDWLAYDLIPLFHVVYTYC